MEKSTKYKLLLYEIETKNGEIKMNKKDTLQGDYFLIDSNSMIFDNFLISSHGKSNSLVKINKDEKLTLYKKF